MMSKQPRLSTLRPRVAMASQRLTPRPKTALPVYVMQEAVNQYQKIKAKPKSKSELLADSFHEMLGGLKRHYDMTGDLSVKEIIDRADVALKM